MNAARAARELTVPLELGGLLRSDVFRDPTPAPDPGRPVMLVPAFLAADRTLRTLAGWLRRAGYAPARAGIRLNVDCSEAESGRLMERLERAVEAGDGRRAVVIGHSRGGMFARVLAVRRPDLVAGIVTLGSPLVDVSSHINPLLGIHATLLGTLGDVGVPGLASAGCGDPAMFEAQQSSALMRVLSWRTRRVLSERIERGDACCTPFWRDFHADFPDDVAFTSIYSHSDGILDWPASLDPAAVGREVGGSHCGLIASAPVYRELQDALADITG